MRHYNVPDHRPNIQFSKFKLEFILHRSPPAVWSIVKNRPVSGHKTDMAEAGVKIDMLTIQRTVFYLSYLHPRNINYDILRSFPRFMY